MKKSERTKQRILEATIETISRHGYASTTTKEIAQNAGVSEGTIFKYYGTKSKLLQEIVEDLMHEFHDYSVNHAFPEFIKQNDGASPRQLLRNLLEERAEFFRERKAATKVILQEMMVNDSIANTFKEEIWGKMEKVTDAIFDEGKSSGELVDADNRILRRTVLGTFFFRVIFEEILGVNRGEDQIEETVDLLFAGLEEGEK
ncbi:MAG: TetR/AcrR family transcriptional regulator [Candidatus Bipolaricaulota bacterium]